MKFSVPPAPSDYAKWFGNWLACYRGYAAEPAWRHNAASGALVSALLIHLLSKGTIRGALLCRLVTHAGEWSPHFFIAQTQEDILAAQGSHYAPVHFAKEALPLIDAFEGPLAVVALPCDLAFLAHANAHNPERRKKIVLSFSLFCGGNSEKALTDRFLAPWVRRHGPLRSLRFRRGHWRGRLCAEFEDGTAVEKPFSCLSDYRNLYFFLQTKCLSCWDHAGYHADLSAGDLWSLKMKRHPVKHTALIVRTRHGLQAVESAARQGMIHCEEITPFDIYEGQKRALPFHYNVSARARAAQAFGMTIRDAVGAKVRWNDMLAAWIMLFNQRLSQKGHWQESIFKIPRPVLKAYLLFLKMLQSL